MEPKNMTLAEKIAFLGHAQRDGKLNEFETKFVADQTARFNKYGDSTRMSDKQTAVLDKTITKYAKG